MTKDYLLDDRDLLAQIARRDEQAFRMIYDKYAKRVFLFSMRVLNSEELAEEVMQEAMLKIWLLGAELLKINNFEAYLKRLTRNRSLDVLSRMELELVTSQIQGKNWAEIDNSTEEEIILRDTRKVLQSGIDALPPQQNLVYRLYHQDGLKYEEIAEKLGLSPATVQTHMKLAMRFLRKYVSRHTDITALLIIFKLL